MVPLPSALQLTTLCLLYLGCALPAGISAQQQSLHDLPPLRITPVLQLDDSFSDAQRSLLTDHVLPVVQAWVARTVKLKHATVGNLKLLRKCTDLRSTNEPTVSMPEWLTQDMATLCFEFMEPTCHHARIPDELLEPASLCTAKDSSKCQSLPDGPGIDTDFVIFFTNIPTVACSTPRRGALQDDRLCHGSFCTDQLGFLDRPLATNINLCTEAFPSQLYARDTAVLAVLREVLASIAMDSLLVVRFRNSVGEPRLRRQPDGTVLQGDMANVLTASYLLSSTQLYMTLPGVVAAAAEHFGCPELTRLELERAEVDIDSSIIRWEERLLSGDLMSGGGAPQLTAVVSNITLALLEDSGWYVPDYSRGGPLAHGAGQGCSFANARQCALGNLPPVQGSTQQCSTPEDVLWDPNMGLLPLGASPEPGYSPVSQYQCMPAGRAVAQCADSPDTDFCDVLTSVSRTSACTLPTDDSRMHPAEVADRQEMEERRGNSFGPSSACLPSTLWQWQQGAALQTWAPRGAACYEVSCLPTPSGGSAGGAASLVVHLAGETLPCPVGQHVAVQASALTGFLGLARIHQKYAAAPPAVLWMTAASCAAAAGSVQPTEPASATPATPAMTAGDLSAGLTITALTWGYAASGQGFPLSPLF
eukprot:CAMPEP_0117679680 /NCGR_PEP_ID=MMETSP0804-20121206/17940_1 /TAXON_ID=1074897 /ORGANISM="Tetraselmis astigmatica, Strain CCMP880" /LENGTH=646 /DNA_ID=CAMNT_0005489111 /DNA_START=299 /DNA_END=2240 /DNA_ORIENTATION=-